MLSATDNPALIFLAAASVLAMVIVVIEVRDRRRRRAEKNRGADSLVSPPKPLTREEAQARSARREGTKRNVKRGTAEVSDTKRVVLASAPPEAPVVAKAPAVAPKQVASGKSPKPVPMKAPAMAAAAPSGVQGAIVPKAFIKAKEVAKGAPEVRDVTLVRDVSVAPREAQGTRVGDDVADAYDFTRSARQWKPVASTRNHSSGPVFIDAPIQLPASAPPIIGQGDESEEELEALRQKYEEESRKIEKTAVNAVLARRSARTNPIDSLPDNSGETVIPEIRAGARALSRRAPVAETPVPEVSARMAAAIAASVAKVSAPVGAPITISQPEAKTSARATTRRTERVESVSDFESVEEVGADALMAAAIAGAPGLESVDEDDSDMGTNTWMAKVSSRRAAETGHPDEDEAASTASASSQEPMVSFHADASAVDVSSRVRMVDADEEDGAAVISSDVIIRDLTPVVMDDDGNLVSAPVPTRDPSDPESFDLIRVGHASAKLLRVKAEEDARQNASETDVDEERFDLHRQPLRIVRDTRSVRMEVDAEDTLIQDRKISIGDDEPVRASDSMIISAVGDPSVIEDSEAVASEDSDVEVEPSRETHRIERIRSEVAASVANRVLAEAGVSPVISSLSDERMIDDEDEVVVPTSQRIDIAEVPVIDEAVSFADSNDDEEVEVDIYMDINSESMRAPMVDIDPTMIDDTKVVVPFDLLEPGMGEDDDSETERSSARRGRRGSTRSGSR